MRRWLCQFMGHKIIKTIGSDYLCYCKGERSGVAVFSGKVELCSCGAEHFSGDNRPWFEGSKAYFNQLYGQLFDDRENCIS